MLISRWTRNCNWLSEFFGSYSYVLLLHGCCYGSTVSEISMVEKVHDMDSVGKKYILMSFHYAPLLESSFVLIVVPIY